TAIGAQNFAPTVNYAAQAGTSSIAKGDFNGDGNLDLIAANTSSASLSLFLGTGDGTFAAANTIALSGNPVSLAVADFNGDGKLDVAVSFITTTGFQPIIQILDGTGDGTFQAPVTLIESAPGLNQFTAGNIVAADANGDGHPDLFATINGLTVFLNDG